MTIEPRRDITKLAQIHWDKNLPFKRSNTEIYVADYQSRNCNSTKHDYIANYLEHDFVALRLFNYTIAAKKLNANGRSNGIIVWSMRGFGTSTTRERLRMIGINIRQRNYQQEYFDELLQKWIPFNPHSTYEYNRNTKEIKLLREHRERADAIDSAGTNWRCLL